MTDKTICHIANNLFRYEKLKSLSVFLLLLFVFENIYLARGCATVVLVVFESLAVANLFFSSN
jgi:hypothetical protein